MAKDGVRTKGLRAEGGIDELEPVLDHTKDINEIVDDLLEDANPDEDSEYDFSNQWDRVGKPGDRFHVTPVKNLTGIAKKGLQPNIDGQFGFNFDTGLARNNSRDRVFYTARLADTDDWHRLIGRNYGENGKENLHPVRATLRAKDPDPDQFHVDDLGNNSEQYSEEPMPTDKLDVWHAKTGWTPLAAHSPERWAKVRPGHLRLDAKPKGQMQLFPKELYNEAVMNIVDALLAETTFMKAYHFGGLHKDDIRAMSAMRREAGDRYGQKIPVLSTDSIRRDEDGDIEKYNGGSRAFPEREVDLLNASGDNMEYEMSDKSPTQQVHGKLAHTTPHVLINVGFVGKGGFGGYGSGRPIDRAVEVLGHELGHIIDPVQNEPEHGAKDRKGRLPGLYDFDPNPSAERKAVMKSEGRAWRVGNELQRATGNLDRKRWTDVARFSLRSYTGQHIESINEIVDSLLDETTFMQAFELGDLTPKDIKAMSAMRKEASNRVGQKIPVLSTNKLGGDDGPSRATTARSISVTRQGDTAEYLINLLHTMSPHSKTENLAYNLRRQKPFVQVNVGWDEHKDAVPTLGHELGHVVDPVQNEPEHAEADKRGRHHMNDSDMENLKPEINSDTAKVMKSEGRAWRVGRELQRSAGAYEPSGWKNVARNSLKGYAGDFLK